MNGLECLWLVPLGAAAGMLGTLVGVGGGLVLLPALFFLYPDRDPVFLTAVSLAVIVVNATAGTCFFAWQKRVDWVSVGAMSAAAAPGAVAGALLAASLPGASLRSALGVLFLLAGTVFLFRPRTMKPSSPACPPAQPGRLRRRFTDRAGQVHAYAYPLPLGLAANAGIGFLSSLLGIGGGVFQVPLLVGVLGFPVHVALATSQALLVSLALAGSLTHLAQGTLSGALPLVACLALGVVPGAWAGSALARRVQPRVLLQVFAAVLALAGARLLLPG